jgi:hypothetical protein
MFQSSQVNSVVAQDQAQSQVRDQPVWRNLFNRPALHSLRSGFKSGYDSVLNKMNTEFQRAVGAGEFAEMVGPPTAVGIGGGLVIGRLIAHSWKAGGAFALFGGIQGLAMGYSQWKAAQINARLARIGQTYAAELSKLSTEFSAVYGGEVALQQAGFIVPIVVVQMGAAGNPIAMPFAFNMMAEGLKSMGVSHGSASFGPNQSRKGGT